MEKQSRVPIIFVLETKINVSDSRSGRLAHVKNTHFMQNMRLGPRVGLESLEKKKVCSLAGDRNSVPRLLSQ